MKAQISLPVLLLPVLTLTVLLAGCAPTWSTASFEPASGTSGTGTTVEWSGDPSAVVIKEGDITEVSYKTLGVIKVTVNKTKAFEPDPTREMVAQKLREEAAKIGATAVVLVKYSDVHITGGSWGSRDGQGRAIKLPPGYDPKSALAVPLKDFSAADARLACGQINVDLLEITSKKQIVEDALQGKRTERETVFFWFGILASATLAEGDDDELVQVRDNLHAREATLGSLKRTKGCGGLERNLDQLSDMTPAQREMELRRIPRAADKLVFLKILRDGGLVSNEEYTQKKNTFMDEQTQEEKQRKEKLAAIAAAATSGNVGQADTITKELLSKVQKQE